MFAHPYPDPVAFEFFGVAVRWYGLMYLLGFVVAWRLALRLRARPPFFALRQEQVETLLFAAVIGVVVGGRLGYAAFYQPAHYWHNPADIARVWQGGMSFHGGLLGVAAALLLVAAKMRRQFTPGLGYMATCLLLLDLAAVIAPPGLGLGRLGNFINAELPGRAAAEWLPWSVVYGALDSQPRHPSQLYQALGEGAALAGLMLFLARRPRPPGFLAAAFLCGYGAVRFVCEFFREPDAHLGLLFLRLSLGQWLCLPMIFGGGAGLLLLSRRGGKGGNGENGG